MRNPYFKTIIIFLIFTGISKHMFANNPQVSNLNIANIDTTLGGNSFAEVEFDISWENSWRDIDNWDAVWVFIKYRKIDEPNTTAWSHASLNYVDGANDGHTAATGANISTPSDGKGVFVFRNSNGIGNVNFVGNRIQWNYFTDGLSTTDSVDIKIFCVEMVHVPQGAFFVGDGQTTASQIYGNFEAGTTGLPFQVNSENSIVLGGGGAGSLGNNNGINQWIQGADASSADDFNDAVTQTLPEAFPKGFDAFYCMKYELTQQEFVNMLNCLTPTQQNFLSAQGHFVDIFNSNSLLIDRYGITQSGGVFSTVESHLPLIYCDWKRAAAYADWSALRPMTDLEFEKACRGTNNAVVNEFAWGNANSDLSNNLTVNNQSQANEGVASGYDSGGVNGNIWVRTGSQSMIHVARVGIFAAHANNSGRVTSGGSFWGIMDLSGNAWERDVSVGHTEGRKFEGGHGDGNLSSGGRANMPNWPGTFSSGIVDTNIGMGYRGGALAYPSSNLERNGRVSSRRLASSYYNAVILDDGARFVRTDQ